jgi:hypothetical protein
MHDACKSDACMHDLTMKLLLMFLLTWHNVVSFQLSTPAETWFCNAFNGSVRKFLYIFVLDLGVVTKHQSLKVSVIKHQRLKRPEATWHILPGRITGSRKRPWLIPVRIGKICISTSSCLPAQAQFWVLPIYWQGSYRSQDTLFMLVLYVTTILWLMHRDCRIFIVRAWCSKCVHTLDLGLSSHPKDVRVTRPK